MEKREAKADGEDYPSMGFIGIVEFNYVGLGLYARFSSKL